MDTGVTQWSPVSPIVFTIYLSVVFKDVEKGVEGYMATSFTDDCWWLVEANSMELLGERLTRAIIKVVEWGERNHIAFDN